MSRKRRRKKRQAAPAKVDFDPVAYYEAEFRRMRLRERSSTPADYLYLKDKLAAARRLAAAEKKR